MSNADAIARIIDDVLAAEQGYVNNPADRGGETHFGITAAVARANGYHGAMKDMPRAFAEEVYRKRYVEAPGFGQVLAVNAAVARELVDTGVNMGPATAATFLQRWLNAFNFGGRYQALFVDGRIGPVTIAALKAFLAWRGKDGETALLRGLNGVQATRYLEITERDPSQRQFIYGWIINRVD